MCLREGEAEVLRIAANLCYNKKNGSKGLMMAYGFSSFI